MNPARAAYAAAVSVCLLSLLSGVAWAQVQARAAYTVQVAALSDADAALATSGELLRSGFPSYVVGAEGPSGSVYRVRVGAFADRATADRYAAALERTVGGAPRPALAESIPAGLLPLVPSRLALVAEGERLELLDAPTGGLWLRAGPADAEALYVNAQTGERFQAWWAAPRPSGGRYEVARLPLDDLSSETDPLDVRNELLRQRVALIAGQADLPPGRIQQEAIRGEVGERFLVVFRARGSSDELRGVLLASEAPSSRASDAWIGEAPPEAPAAALVVSDSLEASSNLSGGSGDVAWQAAADGPWVALTAGDKRWRGLAGVPVRAREDLLIVSVPEGFDVVRLNPVRP